MGLQCNSVMFRLMIRLHFIRIQIQIYPKYHRKALNDFTEWNGETITALGTVDYLCVFCCLLRYMHRRLLVLLFEQQKQHYSLRMRPTIIWNICIYFYNCVLGWSLCSSFSFSQFVYFISFISFFFGRFLVCWARGACAVNHLYLYSYVYDWKWLCASLR